MRQHRLLLGILVVVAGPGRAFAQDRDPFNLDSQAGFTFDFYPTAGGNVNDGEGDAWDFCYTLTVDGTAFNAGGPATSWYDGRGFRTREHDMGTLVTQRYGFVPRAGLSFARWIDVVRNTGNAEQIVTFSYYCNLGSDGGETVTTADGDAQFEVTDAWGRTDDLDNGGDPSLGHVFFGQGGDQGLTFMRFDPGSITWNYDVRIPAGGQAAIMIFGVQQRSRALADGEAAQLAGLQGEALEGVEDEINDVVNFAIGPADGPRLRPNGPYRVDEGGMIQLGVEITDPNGDPLTWSWDFDDDGTYGDAPNVLDPIVDASDVDGPATIRVGIEISDGANVVQRDVTVTVSNVAPAVSSDPITDATTGQPYVYAIAASDIPADTITYAVDEGPAGMIVSGAGVVSWTPLPDGRGPQVPVTILVGDGDGGETEHAWLIDMHGGPIVVPGGPYAVEEGGEVRLSPIVSDPEGDELTYGWDLDADGDYDDSTEPVANWSAAGIDGPAEGYAVHLLVSDGTYEIVSDIPVAVRNAPPVFLTAPSPFAYIGREWRYEILCDDPGDDAIEITVDEDEMPAGMLFDAVTSTLSWTPREGALLGGEPLGTYTFTVTAEDEDRGRTRQDVVVTATTNRPPPVPALRYPNGEAVRTTQPTILLDNVEDPDGDTVTYFVQVDDNPCFCSPALMSSGPLEQGALGTSFPLPRPLNVDEAAGGSTTFYIQRWTSDGLAESEKELALFTYEEPEGGDGDADTDADADSDDGGAGPDTGDDGGTCACRAAGHSSNPAAPSLTLLAFAAILLGRRRRRRR